RSADELRQVSGLRLREPRASRNGLLGRLFHRRMRLERTVKKSRGRHDGGKARASDRIGGESGYERKLLLLLDEPLVVYRRLRQRLLELGIGEIPFDDRALPRSHELIYRVAHELRVLAELIPGVGELSVARTLVKQLKRRLVDAVANVLGPFLFTLRIVLGRIDP